MEALARVVLIIVALILVLGLVLGAGEFLHPTDTKIKWLEWESDQQQQAVDAAFQREQAAQNAQARADFMQELGGAAQRLAADLGGVLVLGVALVCGALAAAVAALAVPVAVRLFLGRPAFAPPAAPGAAPGAQQANALAQPAPQPPPRPVLHLVLPTPQEAEAQRRVAAYANGTAYAAPAPPHENGNGAHGNGSAPNAEPPGGYLAGHRNDAAGRAPNGREDRHDAGQPQNVRRSRPSYRQDADREDEYRAHHGR